MGLGNFIGMMEGFIKGNGFMGNSMELEFRYFLMENKKLHFFIILVFLVRGMDSWQKM